MAISFSSARTRRKSRAIYSAVHQLKVEQLEARRLLAGRAADAINAFAFDVYDNLQREQGNLFFSPLSVSTALGMAYAGARGNTATQLENVAHFGSTPGIHDSFQSLYASYAPFATSVGGGPQMSLANAFWPDDQLPVIPAYASLVQNNYQAMVQAVDYDNPSQAESIINQWVAQNTDGLITQLVRDLGPDTAFVLTNALGYKASWEDGFDPTWTTTEWFTRKDGTTVSVSMMAQQVSWPHFAVQRIGDFIVADLPLAGGTNHADMSFIVAQPVTADSPDVMTRDVYAQLMQLMQQPNTGDNFYHLQLPKFEMSATTIFAPLVKGLGATDAFELGVADFSGMTSAGPALNRINQNAVLSVDEQGLHAAAATFIDGIICFAAGTPVLTPDGVRPIEEIQVGDLVLSRDQFNIEGEVRARPVEKIKRGNAEVLELVIGGQVIRATAPHPFFVRGRGWTAASDLIAGDLLATDGENWIAVQSRRATGETVPVFNFDVAHDHTYFVGGGPGTPGIWVHNDYGDHITLNRSFHFFITDNTSETILFMGRLHDPSQLTSELTPTVVIEANAAFNYLTTPEQTLTVNFNRNISASLAATDFVLTNLNTNTTVALTLQSISADGKSATLTFSETGNDLGGAILTDGHYRIRTLAGQIEDAAGNVLSQDVDHFFDFKNADFALEDTIVDFNDLQIIAQNYNTGPGKLFSQGDANYDGYVNFNDLLAVAQRYGTGIPELRIGRFVPTKSNRIIGDVFGSEVRIV